MQFAYKNEDYQTLSFPVEVEDESEGTLALPSHCYFRSIVTGNGILHLDIPYLRSYLKPNLSLFTGKIIGNGTKSGTILLHETQWSAPRVRFELKGGITMVAWTTNATNVIGGLSGDAGTFLGGSSKQTKGFTCLWQVGGANSDETFNVATDWQERIQRNNHRQRRHARSKRNTYGHGSSKRARWCNLEGQGLAQGKGNGKQWRHTMSR